MKYNKPVFVKFDNTHRKTVQDGLLHNKAIKLVFDYDDFGSGDQIYLTTAQFGRLQAALKLNSQIELGVPSSQLSNPTTGFMSIINDTSIRPIPESEDEPEQGEATTEEDEEPLSEKLSNITLSDNLVGVGLSVAQRKKLCSSCGDVRINLSKTGLIGDDMLALTDSQREAITTAQQKGVGVRLTLSEPAYEALKKSPTS